MTDEGPIARVVAVANGDYATLVAITDAVPSSTDLVELLEDRHGFDGVVFADLRRGALLDELDRVLAKGSLQGAALVLLWTGHGVLGADGSLRLMGRTTDAADDEVAAAAKLGEWAARTGAAQVLVILDTCFSGGGVPDTLAMANAVLAGRADPSAAYFGVLAASRGDEPARSTALAKELKRLLADGPNLPELRLRWSSYKARVRGDDLLDAVVKEWSEPRHSPHVAQTGNARPMIANPLHRPGATHHVVEHLLQAARGSSTEQGFFTGREVVLARLVSWMGRSLPGLAVVTGPAGSGKSAILGRLVSLSVPSERSRLLTEESAGEAASPPPVELDPGQDAVDAHLHARGLDLKGAVAGLAAQLALEPDAGIYDVLALAGRRRADGAPLVVVVDGLDEAGDAECRDLAVQLIEPLAREALVLVGTREVPGGSGAAGLLTLLGAPAELVDLGTEIEATLHDVHRYVVRRLDGVSATMAPERVADEIVGIARSADSATEGPFLLARLVTSQLRERPVDTSLDDWRSMLSTSVEIALEHDLEGTVLTIDGKTHPTAARELLAALACAHGAGFPADDVWPAAASAITMTGTTYTREDVYQLLLALGRHVVAGAEGDQAVYRVAHQRLVDHLRPTIGTGRGRSLNPDLAVRLADGIATVYGELLDEGQSPRQHTYLWRHAWRHFADAGPPGIEMLRRFVQRDRESFRLDLALALNVVASWSWWSGSPQDAVALLEECVDLHRELGDPVDLTMALFDLAFARASAGDADGSDEAAAEAVDVARSASDETANRPALAAAMVARSLTQLRQGNADPASRLATEAVNLLDAELAGDPGVVRALAGACSIAANAYFVVGNLAMADETSRRAVDVIDQLLAESNAPPASPEHDDMLVDALSVRALVELSLILVDIANRTVSPRLATTQLQSQAAARIVALHRRRGRTGSITDIATAEGLRMQALLISMGASDNDGDAPEDDPLELLAEAIGLVSPMAPRSGDATIALAAALVVRARLTGGSSPDDALADLARAEAELRRYPSSPTAALQLGEVLVMQVQLLSVRPEADLQALIERQEEAIELLGQSEQNVLARQLLADSLGRLTLLLVPAGRGAELTDVRDAAVRVRRSLYNGSPMSTIQLAIALSDLASGIFLSRPIEAADLAEEAIELLGSLEDNPQLRTLRGFAHLNFGAAQLALAHFDDARGPLERAVELLDTEPTTALALGGLGLALHNLSFVHLDAGEHAHALDRSRRAVSILEQPGLTVGSEMLPLARINLGRALRANGRGDEATESLRAGVDELRARLSLDELSIAHLAGALDAAGAEVWDEVLTDLHDQPAVARQLTLYRHRPLDELDLTVRDLVALYESTNDDAGEHRAVRETARARRADAPERFDELWADATGELPSWLLVDPDLTHLVIAWWNTPTWAASRDYLVANPLLLGPDTELLLDELRESGADDDLADAHAALLSAARADGVERAYAERVADELVREWLDAEDEQVFLTDHQHDLLAPDVVELLQARRDDDPVADACLAVLTLTTRGETALAYRIVADRSAGIGLLQPAWRSADTDRLRALATLCRFGGDPEDADVGIATVALAIAAALDGRSADAAVSARTAIDHLGADQDVAPLIAAVTDAMAHQPDRAQELFELLAVMRAAPSRRSDQSGG